MPLALPRRHTLGRDGLLLAGGLAAFGAAVATVGVFLRRSHTGHQAQLLEQRPLLEEAQRKARAAGLDPTAPPPGEDDLKVIEGIGPRAEAALHAAGITRYEALASLRPGRLRKILRASGGRMSNPTTWPEQARLAAAGDWDALIALQKELSGGRRRAA
jgi:predicted flap endonuclease-1-like 5' DNA nuclease